MSVTYVDIVKDIVRPQDEIKTLTEQEQRSKEFRREPEKRLRDLRKL